MSFRKKPCAKSQSTNFVKYGSNGVGTPKYKAKNCCLGSVFQSRRISKAVNEQWLRPLRSATLGVDRLVISVVASDSPELEIKGQKPALTSPKRCFPPSLRIGKAM